MSDIQLSGELLKNVQAAVQKQSPNADAGEVMQYLAAVAGYMLGNQSMAYADKQSYMAQLAAFASQVMDDTHKRMDEQLAATQAKQADPANAFGYWTPAG